MIGIKNCKIRVLFWMGLGILIGLAASVSPSRAARAEAGLNKPVHGVIVPDRFLRRWDPVTIFFDRDAGPAGGGPEDAPEKYATLSPDHPGAYTWLDGRTLQFRPAEPWPPLTRFTWRIRDRVVMLDTLMSAPVSTIPRHGASELSSVETFTLTFAEPVNPGALARMISVELRPLPGVEDGSARWLNQDHFDVKILERRNRSDQASYVLLFHDPIPPGTRTIVHLRLSLADRVEQAFRKIAFSTAEPFHVTHVGWAGQQYPVTTEGVRYTPEQAIRCSARDRRVQVRFSARPGPLDPAAARGLVRFTPAVEELAYQVSGNTLFISGRFLSDVLHQVDLTPAPIRDEQGRELQMKGPSRLFLFFPPRESYLGLKTGHGVLERFGPQMAPLEGRNFERVDVRIHAIDPLDRSFWPFPGDPVFVDEEARPPSPGEEPEPFTNPERYISPRGLAERLKALGSPLVSTIRPIPLRKGGGAAGFGLDLAPLLQEARGKNAPGAYLVGVRNLDGNRGRAWTRLQVTDLCLTTMEGDGEARFFVTSLSTGLPEAGARIRLEGAHKRSNEVKWVEIVSGLTDHQGLFTYQAPGSRGWNQRYIVRRIVVEKEGDILVLNPNRAPKKYVNNHWESSRETWLQWTQVSSPSRGEHERILCHIFTERPVYRPDEPVHIKGYVRRLSHGKFSPVRKSGFVIVNGPGDMEWRYPVDLSERGSFYYKFDEEKLPTGQFRARLELNEGNFGSVYFRKEAYRLPKFEVQLHGPDRVGLDREFSIRLNADYYAGGPAADRPVRWRVTQFPYAFIPKKMPGWFYSTDARFSGDARFRSTPAREKEDRTDEGGGAVIRVDPGREPTSQPRRYVIEATVTGADDQTVSNTREVKALPPFVLGVKVPRYIKNARSIEPEIMVMGPDGKFLPGQPVKVSLLHRQWHSVLKAGDFSRGKGEYITEMVDEKIHETTVMSGEEPGSLRFDI
ncbi:MAG: alpha-2-macroglobulin, partial [Desulfobacterales bacterium]|nr:alpha-2-macroglobulin [Desulfobacterales bacterium]